MPLRTYISKKEKSASDFKASKIEIHCLLGGNANGDKKLRPMLVYRSENPHALKNVAKSSLPVIRKSHRKVWVTKHIFRDWFVDYFVPEITTYCNENNTAFKVLLILDNAAAHDLYYVSMCPNINIVFLPPRTTSLMQPSDQCPSVSLVF
jgi:hypothetical protein